MRVLVLGDGMTDTYWTGTIRRLNPEGAHIQLISDTTFKEYPGGARNVVENFKALGVDVRYRFGEGRIVKHRVVADGRVMHRFDVGNELKPIDTRLLALDLEDKYDAIVVSDYGKGSITKQILELLSGRLYIDTKQAPIEQLAEVTWFPNDREFRTYAAAYSNVHCCVRKCGALGVTYISSLRTLCVPCLVKEVSNVAGAGDTVLAAFVYAQLRGLDIRECLVFTQEAAAVVVGQLYTYAPTLREIAAAFPAGIAEKLLG